MRWVASHDAQPICQADLRQLRWLVRLPRTLGIFMRLPVLTLLSLSITVLPNVVLAEVGDPLCTDKEKPVFSCQMGAKTVSLCMPKEELPETGYLKYRFGRNARAIELEYPRDTTPAQNLFLYSNDGAGKGSISNVQFSVGAVKYTIFRFRHPTAEEHAGVAVVRPGRDPVLLRCGSTQIDEMQLVARLALREVPKESFVEGW